MKEVKVALLNSEGRGFVIPLGPVNLVGVAASKGLVGCGAIDVAALEKFGYPAARVRPSVGSSVSTIADLLAGVVKEANEGAKRLGVTVGMTGKDALDLLS
ncbi:MAG: hypothetical protein A4E37_01807 [Methanoregulaceae archaeon PtaB.Bin056]|jgi:uncharacterized protein YunC (DUF1805 family)|nr:MAG: hypothetical protein A4E37_01807 [Methanoregulaceae archaeon PtaB.Bin056]